MTEYLVKRGIALFIDGLIYGMGIFLVQKYIGGAFAEPSTLLAIMMFLPYFFKDALFNGASIGKRMMRLAVYKTSWERLSFWESFKRVVLVSAVGYVVFLKSFFSEEGTLSFFDWERDCLRAVVIESAVYRRLSEKAEGREEMLALYNEYLRSLYIKK